MTQDEIIEMAIKAELNLYVHDLTEKQYIQVIEAFAKLVAVKAAEREREACAMVAEQRSEPGTAAFIRARGEV
jgi:hypothetical protein